VSEISIRLGLQLGDASDGVEVLSSRVIRETMHSIGYRDGFPKSRIKKGSIHPRWKYIAHCIQHCFAKKRTGFDTMSAAMASVFVGLIKGDKVNVSKIILNSIKENQATSGDKKF
jgi:hypothetical protein